MLQTLSILGLGYIGLPTAVAFANAGVRVYGVDTNPHIIRQLNQAQSHINEPELTTALQQAITRGNFSASTEVQPSDAFIIAVPTPLLPNKQADLSYIRQTTEMIAPRLQKGNLVILESTSPVSTTEQLAYWLKQQRPDLTFAHESEQADIAIAYCPERVLPGRIMSEIVTNDRIVGGLNQTSTQQAIELYRLFVTGECIAAQARTAELCKLAENAYRDVNIAFANELSLICDQLNIDLWRLTELANRHPRVNILQAGAGVGGHCIAVDPWFIVSQNPQAKLIRTAREVNDCKPLWVEQKIQQAVAEYARKRDCKPSEITIACFGLAFKADVGDLRESPALQIVEQITEWHTGRSLVVEPNIAVLPPQLAKKVEWVSQEFALSNADVVALLVDHKSFKTISRTELSAKWIVDTRGIWR